MQGEIQFKLIPAPIVLVETMHLYQKIDGQNGENNGCENHKTKIEQNAFV